MNLSKLTFGQLWKLHHQSTLCRVTAAYHGMLERRTGWSIGGSYGVKSLEDLVSCTVKGAHLISVWKNLLAFLTGRELRFLLREAAYKSVRMRSGMWSDLAFVSSRDVGGKRAALARAEAIRFFSCDSGVPAEIVERGEGLDHYFVVRVETDEIGAAALRYHPGIPFCRLQARVELSKHDPSIVFWWVPGYFSGLVNPCLKPIRTPDEAAQRSEILQTAGN